MQHGRIYRVKGEEKRRKKGRKKGRKEGEGIKKKRKDEKDEQCSP